MSTSPVRVFVFLIALGLLAQAAMAVGAMPASPTSASPASASAALATSRLRFQDPETTCRQLAPATPTPTPASDDSAFVAPTPTLAPDPGAVVDPLLDPMAIAAAANLEACWQVGNWHAVAAAVTPSFLQTALGIDAPDIAGQAQALAALDPGPIHIETIGSVQIWNDGRGAVEVFYTRGRGRPLQAVAARWFLIAERGVVRFDEEILLLPPPLGDRLTIGFAIPDDNQPLAWSGPGGQVPVSPVITLHGANRGRESHTFLLEDDAGQTLGVLTLPPWQQADLILLHLPPGTYRLVDPSVSDSKLTLVVGEG